MLRISLTRGYEGGATAEIVPERSRAPAELALTIDGKTTNAVIEDRELAQLYTALEGGLARLLPSKSFHGLADSTSLSIVLDSAQATFHWAASTPSGWEGLHPVVQEVIALARKVNRSYALR